MMDVYEPICPHIPVRVKMDSREMGWRGQRGQVIAMTHRPDHNETFAHTYRVRFVVMDSPVDIDFEATEIEFV